MTDMPIIQYTDPQTPTIAESSSSANSSTPSTPGLFKIESFKKPTFSRNNQWSAPDDFCSSPTRCHQC
jgi:hypothetical protein